MKPFLLSLLLLMAFLPSCTVSDNKSPLGTSNLPLDSYTIDITRDTVLKTKKGAIIKLPAGTLESKNKQVTIQIREAFSMADMVMAGLVTKSNEDILSSGGMIYINAGEENGVKVAKPIAVAIPTNYVQEGMQLYKGEEKEDGSINWVAPQPLQQDTIADRLAKGKTIFMSNCASCHRPFQRATGPALAGITKYRTKAFLNAFIRNSGALIASGDQLANCLYEQNGKTAMTAFPYMTDDELNMLYEYLENEGKKVEAKGIPNIQASMDSCKKYYELLNELEYRRQGLIAGNEERRTNLSYYTPDSQLVVPTAPFNPDTDKVFLPYNPAVYYNVQIDGFGWYNVDMLLDKLENNAPVKVTATVSPDMSPDVFLVVPSQKIFQQGGFMKDNDGKYGFFKNDGTIPLPQGVWAYIVAISESDGKLLLGIQEFKISSSQEINVTMQSATEDEFKKRLEVLNFNGIATTITKTKNADSIIVIDKELKNIETLRPVNCNCDCVWRRDVNEYDSDTAYKK